MTIVLFHYALGLSAVIACTGVIIMFLLEVPAEGEEVIHWSVLGAEVMTEEQIESKITQRFAEKNTALIGTNIYLLVKRLAAFSQLFLERLIYCVREW